MRKFDAPAPPRTRWLARGLALWLGVMALGVVFWANWRFAQANPGGNDFLPYWVAVRAWLQEGQSPYSPEVALRVQYTAYGRPARPGENRLGVVYPLYTLLLYVPFALIPDYPLARALWMTFLEAALLLTAWAAGQLVAWPRTLGGRVLFFLFALTWYYGLRAVVNGNAVVLAGLMLTLAPWAWRRGRAVWAGGFLAMATLKPNVALLPVVAGLLWAVVHRQRGLWRGALAVGFVLAGLSTALHPTWWAEYAREVLAYPGYNPPTSVWEALWVRSPQAAWVLGLPLGLVVLALLLRAWARVRQAADAETVLWAYAVTLVASQWLVPTDPGNFVVLLPPLAWVAARLAARTPLGAWGLMAAVWVGLWWLFLATLTPGPHGPQQHDVMFLPLPALLWVGLYLLREPKA